MPGSRITAIEKADFGEFIWQMLDDSPNSPNFPPAKITRYTVFAIFLLTTEVFLHECYNGDRLSAFSLRMVLVSRTMILISTKLFNV